MANSLLTGISGLRGHQKMLEVVGNNLANLNTTSFKASRVLFSDLMYELQRGASSTSNGLLGSVNAVQIGTGSRVSQVSKDFQQGNLEASGKPLDLAVDGSGLFVTKSGNNTYFTRAGAFSLDQEGYLSDPATGNLVQRFGALGEPDGVNPSFQTSGDSRIYIPLGASIAGKATQTISLAGNLSSRAVGPVSQKIMTATAFFVGGGVSAATSTTLLADVDGFSGAYVAGDKIEINGQTKDGNNPDVTEFVIDDPATTTVGDLILALNTGFPGSNVQLVDGKIVATDNTPGSSMLNIILRDDPANVGIGTDELDSHKFIKQALGKDGDKVLRTAEVFDSSGASHQLSLELTKQEDGSWDMNASLGAGDGNIVDGTVDGITFQDDGTFVSASGVDIEIQFSGQSVTQVMNLYCGEPGTISGLGQLGASSALEVSQDGFSPGELSDVHVDVDGTVFGLASNGLQIAMGQLAIASFRNNDGLISTGGNYYQSSLASGAPEIGTALSGSRGAIRAGQLEGSNVDLALEFTRLIIAQRGFSANARTITVTDRVLEELTNIIR
jgi:flagellar hook protein FlgE